MAWIRRTLGNGAVFTRPSYQLTDGELHRGRNARYRRGDPDQLHRDSGYSEYYRMNDGQYFDMKHVTFEKAIDGTDIGESQLIIAWIHVLRGLVTLSTVGTDEEEGLGLPGLVVAGPLSLTPDIGLGVVHRGDEYFIGVGAESSKALSASPLDINNYRRMGMKTPEQAGLVTDVRQNNNYDFTADISGVDYYRDVNWRIQGPTKLGRLKDVCDIDIVSTFANSPPDYPRAITRGVSAGKWQAYVYFVTEYDSEYDVESRPYYAMLGFFHEDTAATTGFWEKFYTNQLMHTVNAGGSSEPRGLEFDFTGYEKHNERADSLRLYRWYLGTSEPDTDEVWQTRLNTFFGMYTEGPVELGFSNTPSIPEADYTELFRAPEAFPLGGMLAKIDLEDSPIYTDFLPSPENDGPGRQWDYFEGTAWKQDPPEPWNLGALFGDAVVLNMTESPSVLQYSITGSPEYFPVINRLPIVTDDADMILAMHTIGGFLLVLTRGGAHRVNYLPTSDDPTREAVDRVSTEGIVGRHASTVVTLPNSVAVVWLSGSQLNLTSGRGSVNVCEDWSVESAGLDKSALRSAVLTTNADAGRVELWCRLKGDRGNYHRFDFYYAREHVKGQGFKCLGPHDAIREDTLDIESTKVDVIAAAGERSADRNSRLWYLARRHTPGTFGVYQSNVGSSIEPMEITMGRIIADNPGARIGLRNMMLHHGPVDRSDNEESTIFGFADAKSIGHPAQGRALKAFSGQIYDEVDTTAFSGVSGNYIQPGILFRGSGPMNLAGFWMDLEASDDGR